MADNDRPSTSTSRKRTLAGTFVGNDDQLLGWLEEESEHEFSDIDNEDEDPNFEPEIQHIEEDDISCEEEPNIEPASVVERSSDESQEHFKGKNGFIWSIEERPRTSRIAAHNIIRLPGRTTSNNFEGYSELWLKLIDPTMLDSLVQFTNQKLFFYRIKFKNTTKVELRDTNVNEMKAFIGLMYYSSVFKCNDADLHTIFATDGTGREIFRCVMSRLRFSCLMNCLRFDDSTTREERLKHDTLAPISELFDKFISNSQCQYTPGAYLCIDEMLLPFRGRCKFIIYMPQKPAKYGIKILLLVDARTFYIYNAYIYHGKNSDGKGLTDAEKKMAVPTQSVLRLAKVVENSNRNITADNWFSSIPLVDILLKRGLTYLGTLKKNKAEIPPCFLPSRNRPIESSLYGFTKDFTILSYVPKPNKAVLLLSSSHHNQEIDTDTGKPAMIADYNRTKGGVDEVDKKCSIYCCSRKTRRWPMAIFQRILDMAGINSFVLYQSCNDSDVKMRRAIFLLNMARDLVLNHMKTRVYNERLPRELRINITRVLGKDVPPPPPVVRSVPSSGKKLCSICPSKIKRQTKYICCDCSKPICLQCSKPLCDNCQTKL